MKFRLFVAFLALAIVGSSAVAQDFRPERSLSGHIDMMQPMGKVGNLSPAEHRVSWMLVGGHMALCKVGRWRTCSLGFGLATEPGIVPNGGREVSLLLTAPQGFRVIRATDGNPEWDLNLTPYRDMTKCDWGLGFGVSVGF
jgi:hypothetical protein